MAKVRKTKPTNTKTRKPKSIGPKFCVLLLIIILAIFALVGNIILLKTIRSEMKTSFDYETRTAVEVLASSINTIHKQYGKSCNDGKTIALDMVSNATWNDGRRHFWATEADSTNILAGKKEFDKFLFSTETKTKYGFSIHAGYDEAYFNANAYPRTEEYIRVSTATALVIALFALGACAISFRKSAN